MILFCLVEVSGCFNRYALVNGSAVCEGVVAAPREGGLFLLFAVPKDGAPVLGPRERARRRAVEVAEHPEHVFVAHDGRVVTDSDGLREVLLGSSRRIVIIGLSHPHKTKCPHIHSEVDFACYAKLDTCTF